MVAAQLIAPLALAIAPGEVLACTTFTFVDDIHPFSGLVTDNSYEPGIFTVGFGAVDAKPFGPAQL